MPSNSALLWLMTGLTLGSIPHFIYQPSWVSLTFAAMILWRTLSITHHWPLPKKRLSLLSFVHLGIAGSAITMMIISYGNLIGRDAGIALLTVMLSLKIVEIRNHRDYYVSCFLGYFLVATNFFYSENIATALLMFTVIVILTAGLIRLNEQNNTLSNKGLIKLASQMLLQATPVMLLLFFLFPRIPGPLWGIPGDAHTSITGISDTMTLRNMSDLALSEKIAFVVKFENDRIPKQSELYWRGPVLWNTDGTRWTQFKNSKSMAIKPDIKSHGQAYRYTTTLEPNKSHWLFALDFPINNSSDKHHYLQYDGQLLSTDPIDQRQQITLSSYTDYQLNPKTDLLTKMALQLPIKQHPRSRALAQSWLQQTSDPMALVNKALNYFNQNGFVYTLRPEVLNGDKIDSFIFDSKQGFCQHFAASFTVLMRAAGVPTRIVTGYQGGEINPVNGYLEVRQYDAHAWTEVWIKDKGWIRIDPTSAVSQQRINQGMTTAIPETLALSRPAFIPQNKQINELWQKIRNNLDAIDNGWNQWVLGYNDVTQKSLLKKLGMSNPTWQNMVTWLLVGLAIVSVVLAIYLLYNRPYRDPITKLYDHFCQKAARAGVIRSPQQGPIDFADALKQQFPHQKSDIDHITHLYIDLKYGRQTVTAKQLRQAIVQFRFTRRRL